MDNCRTCSVIESLKLYTYRIFHNLKLNNHSNLNTFLAGLCAFRVDIKQSQVISGDISGLIYMYIFTSFGIKGCACVTYSSIDLQRTWEKRMLG